MQGTAYSTNLFEPFSIEFDEVVLVPKTVGANVSGCAYTYKAY